MGKVNNLEGKRFGRLVCSDKYEIRRKNNGTKAYWLCKCDCGNEKWIRGSSLTSGGIVSCDCYRRENNSILMKKRIGIRNIEGKRYGKIVVLNQYKENKKQKCKKWLCRCDCGKEMWVKTNDLLKSNVYSCGCYKGKNIQGVKDLSGMKFGRLLVSKQYRRKKSGKSEVTQWLCYCSCGNKKWIFSGSLSKIKNSTKSCGCLAKEMASKSNRKPCGYAAMKSVYSQYKIRARKKKILFELNEEVFKDLTTQNCFYCGSDPFNLSAPLFSNGNYFYSGIDRVDNSRGYEVENCVPCCKICNKAKDVLSKEEFMDWIKKVYNHIEKMAEVKNLESLL